MHATPVVIILRRIPCSVVGDGNVWDHMVYRARVRIPNPFGDGNETLDNLATRKQGYPTAWWGVRMDGPNRPTPFHRTLIPGSIPIYRE